MVSSRSLSVSLVSCKKMYRQDNKRNAHLKKIVNKVQNEEHFRHVTLWHGSTPREMAEAIGLKSVNELVEAATLAGSRPEDGIAEALRRKDTPIADKAVFNILAKQLRLKFRFEKKPKIIFDDEEENLDHIPTPPDPSKMEAKPPVVAIMGHIDHGKTTLLDYLRKSQIVDGEFGGITQHIGAFSVKVDSPIAGRDKITFVDTPGHAAFKKMRYRGASATDIVILVVDTAEGVLEQTKESIAMIKAAGTPLVVALNKIDRERSDVEATRKQLLSEGVNLEEYGGDVLSVPVSALKGLNIDKLMEAVLLQAEMLQLKADYKGPVEGVILESTLEQGLGRTATVLVTRGTLKKSSILLAGTQTGKIKKMLDDRNNDLKVVRPAEAARLANWDDAPTAGDLVYEIESERRAKEIVKWRQKNEKRLQAELVAETITEDREEFAAKRRQLRRDTLGDGDLSTWYKMKTSLRFFEIEKKDSVAGKVSILIKADVNGSLEALINVIDSYQKYVESLETDNEPIVDIIDFGVGPVTDKDIENAKTFNGIVYAFNIPVAPAKIMEYSKQGVPVKEFNVIYKMVDDLRSEINLKMPMVDVETVLGEASVVQEFMINVKKDQVPCAGCRVRSGQMKRDNLVKVLRAGNAKNAVHVGKIGSLKQGKDEAGTIESGKECGIILENTDVRFEQGDKILAIEINKERFKTAWNPGF